MDSIQHTPPGQRAHPVNGAPPLRRNLWLKTLLKWHWVSSALAILSLLLFTVTGITLNHAADISSQRQVTEIESTLPDDLAQQLRTFKSRQADDLPEAFRAWMASEHELLPGTGQLEWNNSELYVAFPRPGGDAWLSVSLDSGEFLYEETNRGWIAWANDLHKGRNTGVWWRWFIDVFAVISLIFCLTGLAILWLHARERAAVWPVVGLGILVPVLLAVLTIH